MVINPAPLLSLNDAYAQAGQIQSSKGQAEQQAIEGIGGREATVLKLEATGLLVTEGFFNVEAQAVLIQGPGIRELVTHHDKGGHRGGQAGRPEPGGLAPRLLLEWTPRGRSDPVRQGDREP